MHCTYTPSRCHVNTAALKRNFVRLGDAVSLMPVVKSDAYGHGLLPVARALAEVGARRFAVGTVSEGIALRQAGLVQQIVPLMGVMEAEEWRQASQYSLTVPLENGDDLTCAAQLADTGLSLRVAVKCETGMGRLGFCAEELPLLLETLRSRPGLEPELVLSHLACADQPDEAVYTQAQAECFEGMWRALRDVWPGIERSLNNSAGTLALPQYRYEICRVGLAIYGGNPFAGLTPQDTAAYRAQQLEWVMSVSAPVLRVRQLKAGQSLSYGRIFTASHDITVAVVAAGYATGVARALSNLMELIIHGRRVRQIGRICMSMLMVDVSNLPQVRAGDLAWILGGSAAAGYSPVTAQEMADTLGTIPYEILCQMGMSNPRVYR